MLFPSGVFLIFDMSSGAVDECGQFASDGPHGLQRRQENANCAVKDLSGSRRKPAGAAVCQSSGM